MKSLFAIVLLCLPLAAGLAAPENDEANQPGKAPYLLPGAPSFDLTISQFREKFNQDSAPLALSEFRAITSSQDKDAITRAATKINENLYASSALERGTLKIKSMQITWLPIQGPEQKAAKAKALEYMAAVMRVFAPFSKAQSQKKVTTLLTAAKNKRYYQQTEGAIRYVVADNGEKGLTFAIEPIKLALSESLEGNNK
ncbi:DUF1454 family protein [Atlantibacter subterraneus]|uniref:DUF1454 family protein n=1 Tax=Atlantibacter subterraneus TaxID=255519 RepID=A0A427UQY1_9ENTR|nr:DUF1454 family protein [Enterobacter sp. E76]RSB60127.1 DUF1454 family protein [Atlantibacter subterranea]RSE02161.1 DUF1454 family protein [Atlantibacter subterranea]RSE22757.1 DUF1454 family protein [Atlantibacter subterranea]